MLIITPQSKIDEYFKSDAIGQSKLKELLKGPEYFNSKKEKIEKDYFLIGSAVDCILTGEESEFDKQYYVSKFSGKLSDIEKEIIKKVFESDQQEFDKPNSINDSPNIGKVLNEIDWYNNWKIDTRIKKIIEAGEDYYKSLLECGNRNILDKSQEELINNIVYSIKNNERTNYFFDREEINSDEKLEVYLQLPIYFTYKGINCKALFDMVFVKMDTDVKGIKRVRWIQPFDLKTTGGRVADFQQKAKDFRYDIQAAWYLLALTSKESPFYEKIKEDDTTILDFTFIVESSVRQGHPALFSASPEFIYHGKNGETAPWGNIKGYEDLIDDLIFYQENGFSEEREFVEKKGCIKLGWYKK
ncbi:MAG: hypothetical protein ACRC0V_08510 [Fusobacteriaceae bacterium]